MQPAVMHNLPLFALAHAKRDVDETESEPFLRQLSVPVAIPSLVEAASEPVFLTWQLYAGLLHESDLSGWQTWLQGADEVVPKRLP